VTHGCGVIVHSSRLSLQTLTLELLRKRYMRLVLTRSHGLVLNRNMLYLPKRIISLLDLLDGHIMVSQVDKVHFIALLELILHMEEQSLMLTTKLACMLVSKFQE
jgi:hypothetical protein